VTIERILVKCADIKEDNILHLAISWLVAVACNNTDSK